MEENKDLINQDPYEYYDEGDIEDINTGENYSYNAAPTQWGLIGGGLAFLGSAVALGLICAIYHRDSKWVPLTHIIMCCIGVLVGLMAIGISVMAKKSMTTRKDLNHMLIGLALLLCVVMFCYFLASSVYMFMYRPFHYGFLQQRHSDQNDWKDQFDDWSFGRAWGENRRILWWCVFFGILACIGFLIAAISLWEISRFPIQTAKMILGAACFAGVVLGCFALDRLWTAKNYFGNYAFKDMEHNLLNGILLALIIAIVLFTLNAILNIFKKRAGHFIFGILLIVFLFIFICLLGLVLRDLRKRQFQQIQKPHNCANLIDSFHQDDIKDACDNKYLSTQCTKPFLRAKWETDGSAGFINPQCCQSVNNYLLWPLYICGIFSLLLIAATLVAIACNFYLSDKSEYLEFQNKKMGLPEIIFAVLCILCLVAFGFYWGFRPDDNQLRTNPNNPDVIYSKYTNSVQDFHDPDFEVVDLNKVYNGSVPTNAYLADVPGQISANPVQSGPNAGTTQQSKMHTGNQILTMEANTAVCPQNAADCGFRVGILAINGRMDNPPQDITGTKNSRLLFFNDTNLKNDFQMIYGTPAKLNDYLKNFKFTPFDLSQKSVIAFQSEQLDLSTLNSQGLKSGENPSAPALSSSGTTFSNLSQYQLETHSTNKACYETNSCQSTLKCFQTQGNNTKCDKAFEFYSSNGTVKVIIPLKVLDKDGNRVNYNEQTLVSSSYYDYNGQRVYLNSVNLNNGQLEIDVPKPVRSDLGISVNLSDSADHYLNASEYYVVPVQTNATHTTQELLLLTKDGKGCVGEPNVQQCFANKSLKYSTIEVQVLDDDTQDHLIDKKVELRSGLTGSQMIGSAQTDIYGKANFGNTAYDNYSIYFPGDDIYLPQTKKLELQSEQSVDATMLLHKKLSTTATIQEYVANGTNGQDRDLCLSIRSHNGKECLVNPLNKWCAYAEHINDVYMNDTGYERIKLNKFTVSHYLAYLQDSPAYTSSCPAADPNLYKYYDDEETTMRSLSFDWENVRKLAQGPWQTLYCFTGWGLNSKRGYSSSSSSANPPTAQVCESLYPSTSQYNVQKLKTANDAQFII